MSESTVLPGFGDIGARLRRARERAGMTVAQTAERLRCDPELIERIEAGRFTQIGAPVFVRGHLRRYAELLGEPVGEVLETWERESTGHVSAPDLTQIPKARRPPDPRRLLMPVAAAVLVAVFAVLISWVLEDAPLPPIGSLGPSAVVETAPTAPASVEPEPPSPVPAGEAAEASQQAAAVSAPAEASADAGTSAAADAATGAGGSQRTPAAVALRVRATSDCWLEIYDAEGRRLYFNLLPGGSATTIRGRAPLRVLLGNVPGVGLDLEGRSIGVPPELQRANTAAILLDADGTVRAAPRD